MNNIQNVATNDMKNPDKEIYKKWSSMIHRCYGLNNKKCYDNCVVCDDWLLLSCFHKWAVDKVIIGMELDKDLLSSKNKIYSPDNCVFIPSHINKITTNTNKKSKYMLGVNFHRSTGKFRARVTHKNKRVSLGLYNTESEANLRYLIGKLDVVMFFIATECKDVSHALSIFSNNIIADIKSNEFYIENY